MWEIESHNDHNATNSLSIKYSNNLQSTTIPFPSSFVIMPLYTAKKDSSGLAEQFLHGRIGGGLPCMLS